uniref:MFS domain-containing protein n=1 Tax=Panagrellus redivivus TaxID=6233 RepID=A0A7E4VPL3_PANRE
MPLDSPHFKRGVVFSLTFLSYALYHASRKNLSGVKASISQDWVGNSTFHTHPPLFKDEDSAKNFLGSLDGIFMIFYAAALFFWGWIGDRWNPKHVVVFGMIASAVTLILFGSLPYWLYFYSIPFYITIYILFGIVQACGWPNEVTIMANWFPHENRGAVMGAWASCQPLGNVVGALVISWVLPLGYQWTFAFNAFLIFVGGLLLHFLIDVKPKTGSASGANISENSRRTVVDSEESDAEVSNSRQLDSVEEINHEPITFYDALLLPNVAAYCLCNACVKMVNYAFFFWLPFYLTHKFHWPETEANQLAIWYDLGGIVGSVAGGILSDKLGKRSPVIMLMLLSSLFALFLYASIGDNRLLNGFMMCVLGVTISGPYNLIVGTISVDLGSQPALAGNEKAMSTVTGLIDGTGSAGSAIGQFFVPLVQNAFGWTYVFYMFIVMNLLSALCLLKRFLSDTRVLWRNYRRRGAFSVRRQALEDEPLLASD